LGRILNKIHDFIDKLVNAFGIRTIRGITRDVETGNIYSRPTEAQREAWLDLNTESYNTATMAEPFYSQLLNTVTTKIKEMPSKVQSIIPWLTKNQVKPAEMKWMGVEQWLKDNSKDGVIDKQKFADFLKDNQIEIKEVTKGDSTPVEGLWFVSEGDVEPYTDQEIDGTNNIAVEAETKEQALEIADRYDRNNGNFDEPDVVYINTSELPFSVSPTKFYQWQLAGGENYREMLLTLPTDKKLYTYLVKLNRETHEYEVIRNDGKVMNAFNDINEAGEFSESLENSESDKGAYRSTHWEEPNVLAHVRMNDRVDATGKKVLFLEEVQSDWHQEGKKVGYKDEIKRQAIRDEIYKYPVPKDTGEWSLKELEKANVPQTLQDKWYDEFMRGSKEKVPPAPFAENWHELVMKRMLRYAAENGYDKIAWTTGEQQAERYDLSKQLDRIEYEPAFVNDGSGKEIPGLYEFIAYDKNGKQVIREDEIDLNRIEELAGKEIAQRIKNDVGESMKEERPYRDWRKLTGLDLKVGGEGMKSFYDNLIPGFMNKYVKQWGGKVGEIMIPASEPLERGYLATATVPSVDITDQMKHDVLFKGQSFYNVAGNKNWQWWKNRDWQKEMLALPKKFWEGNTRDFIKEGYIPITRDEADNLYKEDIGEFVSWVMIRGDKTTGIEGIFIKPLSYQGYEPYHYKEKTHYRNQEAYQKYQGFKDRYLRGNAGELAGQGGRGASAVQQYSIRKMEDPPISKDPKVLNLYLKDETDAIVQTIMNKLHPKSMTWLETMLKSPEWFDHPQIQNIVKLFMRDRNELYHETFNELNAFNDSTVTEAAKALRNKGLSLTERLSGKVSPEYQTLMDMIDDGDTRWVRNKKIPLATQLKHFEDAWRKKGATD
ncbi:MAG: hypothetical protein WC554_19005, partial [Clostridia bacterium]